jgi:hypothetical protein
MENNQKKLKKMVRMTAQLVNKIKELLMTQIKTNKIKLV